MDKGSLAIYVYNVTEDEWSFTEAVSHRSKRMELIAEGENAADCYLFGSGNGNDLLYISPKSISDNFQNYVQKLMGYKNTTVLSPQTRSHLICDDLIHDAATFEKLVEICRNYKKISLTGYSASPQLYSLKLVLRDLKIEVITPELPEAQNAWTVNFFGSKSGIRQLAQQSVAEEPDFEMPEGLICVGKYDAAKIAADKYISKKGVVIKTNKGSGGNGVMIFREGDLPFDYVECERAILAKMNSDNYWDYFPIIIEDLINVNLLGLGAFPSVEFKIHRNGRIEMLYYCAMKVTPEGAFYGLDISDDILNERLAARIIDTGYYIGEKYGAAGYRGNFDVDMMITKGGKVYVNESNTRNTGGTDTYRIARKLLGKNFMDDYYVLSRTNFDLPKNKWNLEKIFEVFGEFNYDDKKKEGIIVNSENSLNDSKLIYTIIGKNRKSAYEYETFLKKVLAK